jgi:transcriptional regulator
MFVQPAYAETDIAALHAGMRAWSFATLVTQGASGIQSSLLPFLVDTATTEHAPFGTLVTHLPRHDPLYQDLLQAAEVLVIFQGPHAFVSPSWYCNQMTFPTWNYTLVQARGKPVVSEDQDKVMAVLRRTVAHYDTPLGGSWDFEKIPMSHTDSRLRVIATLEIPITSLTGKMKLNQDKSVEDRLGVIAALEAQGDAQSIDMARLIRAQGDMREALAALAAPSLESTS